MHFLKFILFVQLTFLNYSELVILQRFDIFIHHACVVQLYSSNLKIAVYSSEQDIDAIIMTQKNSIVDKLYIKLLMMMFFQMIDKVFGKRGLIERYQQTHDWQQVDA